MKYLIAILGMVLSLPLVSKEKDYKWWNDIHHWESGMPGWRDLMFLSPGFLGPNALPVPEMKKGYIHETFEIETTLSNHFHPEDFTQDLSAKLYIPFADGKIAFEAWGVILENYHYSVGIRNERVSRDEDGRGIVHGDFYFSTLLQLVKNRKFPNTVFRIACKTASGDADAARFTDTPGYFFDFSFSKSYKSGKTGTLLPYGSFGFYSWQSYNEATPQNDALLYGAGLQYQNQNWLFSGNFSGYTGYLEIRDKPAVLTFESRRDWHKTAARLQVLYGIRDWNYRTIRFSFIWKFGLK